jgi:amino acid adenylation domain-containing protein
MNETEESRPSGGLIAEAVRRWAARSPEAVAFRGTDGAPMTYGELPAAVAGVARALAGHGVEPGDRVALLTGRGRHALGALFGTWALGASAVLLDERHPAARLRQIVGDAGCKLALCAESEAPELGLPVLDPAQAVPAQSGAQAAEPEWAPRSPEDEAYVIYTSGTAGKPKGVRVGSAGLETFLAAASSLGYREGATAAVVVSPAFDGWLWCVLTTFIQGVGCVTLNSQAGPILPQVAAHGVSILNMTPTLYASLGALPEAEVAVVAGERCPEPLAERLRAAAARVINVYGPTEATIAATMADTGCGDDPACIGRALPGYVVEVVDAALRPVEAGVEGELLIGGDGVALGYVDGGRAAPSPFVERDGARYYRTGDLGLLRPDGQFECLGRIDDQVKVGGFRLEYGEVESLARKVPEVGDAIAYLRGTPPTVAVAVVTADADTPAAAREQITAGLREIFAEHLPLQVRPALIRYVAAVPVDPTTGKLARNAVEQLPDLDAPDEAAAAGGEQGSDTCAQVLEAWHSAFGQAVDESSDFYALGGHSLLAAQLANDIAGRLGVEVTVTDVLLQPTPALQAAVIEARRGQ